MGASTGVYRPRRPEQTPFYQCLEGYWSEFKEAYPYLYEADFGPLRPLVERPSIVSWSVASTAAALPASVVRTVKKIPAGFQLKDQLLPRVLRPAFRRD